MYRTLNPATEELIREYSEISLEDALARTKKAHLTYKIWKKIDFDLRRKLFITLANKLRDKKKALSEIMTLEMGKPILQAQAEIEKCAVTCEYYSEHGEKIIKSLPIPTEAKKSYVCFEPLGVILGIMPWNFPFWQVFRFAIPTLLAGNIVIIKPAPNVPQCALEIEKLFIEAGFENHSFQTLFLSNENSEKLIRSGFIQGVSLTGSDRAGSQIAAIAGSSLVKTVLELGGSDPFIVLEDADLDTLVPHAVSARMQNTGQSCIAAKRFIVSHKIIFEFTDAFVTAVKNLKVGDPKVPTNDVGPIAREDLLINLETQVKQSIDEGVKVILGGKRFPQKGYFFEPTVLLDVTPQMACFSQEIFGPVASIISFQNVEQAIEFANQTPYGLGASLWTKDIKNAEKLAFDIEAGQVFINSIVKSDPRLPFGGIKRSGFGRELGSFGMHEFTNIKTVWIGSCW